MLRQKPPIFGKLVRNTARKEMRQKKSPCFTFSHCIVFFLSNPVSIMRLSPLSRRTCCSLNCTASRLPFTSPASLLNTLTSAIATDRKVPRTIVGPTRPLARTAVRARTCRQRHVSGASQCIRYVAPCLGTSSEGSSDSLLLTDKAKNVPPSAVAPHLSFQKSPCLFHECSASGPNQSRESWSRVPRFPWLIQHCMSRPIRPMTTPVLDRTLRNEK